MKNGHVLFDGERAYISKLLRDMSEARSPCNILTLYVYALLGEVYITIALVLDFILFCLAEYIFFVYFFLSRKKEWGVQVEN